MEEVNYSLGAFMNGRVRRGYRPRELTLLSSAKDTIFAVPSLMMVPGAHSPPSSLR